MSSDAPLRKRKLPIARLLLAAAAVCAVLAVTVQILGWRNTWEMGRGFVVATAGHVTGAGPWWYFAAMALMPIVGVPMAPFALAAGPLFREQMGLPVLVLLGVAAVTINLTIAYWLARRWLRPFLQRMIARFGYRLPEMESGDITDLIVLLRATPGVPFFVQNYLLGLANAPFLRYLILSCAIQWSLNTAFMLFGDALSQGRGKLVLTAILLLLAISAATHMIRRRLTRKQARP